MTEHTSPAASDDAADPARSAGQGFENPERLRALLIRLHESGPGAWRSDREAAELMRYTADRYRRLARKYEVDEWEIASAAFEVMLAPSTRNAGNPWAVVTRAMKITCGVEVRAAGLLVSPGKVRHTARIAGFHDSIRFAERERLADYPPAFAVDLSADDDPDLGEDDGRSPPCYRRRWSCSSRRAGMLLSWPTAWNTSPIGLSDLSSRRSAVEVLRRDRTVSALLGLPPWSWAALLRIVLGHPRRSTQVPRLAMAFCRAC